MRLGMIAFAAAGFWMLMVFDCIRNEPKGSSWIWIVVIFNLPGAIVYFVSQKLPDLYVLPAFCKRWTLKEALWNAEAGVYNIGKSPEYIKLGNVLLEMGNLDRALESYQEALSREPSNPHALWGCATVEIQQQKFDRAAIQLKKILHQQPKYKHGEASLLYGRVLYELAEWDKAKQQLIMDVRQWSHPESLLLLAKIAIDELQGEIARGYLENMLAKLQAAPRDDYRHNRRLARQAQQLLKTLMK